MANLLLDGLPETIPVDGTEIPIETGYKHWMRLSIQLLDEDTAALGVAIMSLLKVPNDVMFDLIQNHQPALLSSIGWFLAGGDRHNGPTGKRQVFSLDKDTPYILGAFRQAFGIDLLRTAEMHWWEFLTYLEAVPDDTELKERIKLRSIDASKIKDKGERARIRKAQRAIAIPQRKLTAEEMGAQL